MFPGPRRVVGRVPILLLKCAAIPTSEAHVSISLSVSHTCSHTCIHSHPHLHNHYALEWCLTSPGTNERISDLPAVLGALYLFFGLLNYVLEPFSVCTRVRVTSS